MESPRGKLLIQMSGAPGSGKSTTAKMLANSIEKTLVIDHDLLRSFLLENSLPFEQSAKLAYNLGWTLAEDMIKQGYNVIMDSTCNFQEILDNGAALAVKYGYVYRYVECKADDIDLLDRRLSSREPLRSQRKGVNRPPLDASSEPGSEEASRALFRKWIDEPCRPLSGAIIVDSTQPPQEWLDSILKRVTAAQ
ncbi:hypothetical protein TWF696_007521 [Orbilia brochopaga]|uniref:ATP-binding protein n=1 Tax=Orbilia brochopaga TaxID=3140254 RepID=A0AAV9UNS7_9PEZI